MADVDLTRLMELVDGDETAAREITALFHQSSDTSLQHLQQAVASDGRQAWLTALHDLKGASGNLGFTALLAICTEAHEAVMAGDELRAWHERIVAETRDVQDALDNTL